MGEHWYKRTGEPCHMVERSDGGSLRATTLADARKLNLVPSFSTVDSIRNKYQLNRYLIREAVANSWDFPGEFDTCYEFADAVMAHLDETKGERTGSDMGTEIHDSIESVCKGGEPTPGYEEHTEAALNEVVRLFPDVEDWVSECTFANNPLGYGGMADLHSPSTGVVVDIKTKDFELMDGVVVRPDTTKPYRLDYDQFYQLAAYGRGLLLPPAPAANVFVSRVRPGAVTSRVWTVEELDEGWDVFDAELALWRLVKGYDPRSLDGGVQCAA